MSEPPPPLAPLNYQPPQPPRRTWGRFIIGLVTGGVLAGVAVPASLFLLFVVAEGHQDQDGLAFVVAALPLGLIVVTTIILAVVRKTRSFGLGMLAGIPAAGLALFVICGGMR